MPITGVWKDVEQLIEAAKGISSKHIPRPLSRVIATFSAWMTGGRPLAANPVLRLGKQAIACSRGPGRLAN